MVDATDSIPARAPVSAPRALGLAAAAWGIGAIVALLLRAVARLSPPAVEALTSELGVAQWAIAGVWLLFMGYFEGYRGFQKGFAPRVVARAVHLSRAPRPLHALLAPLFCMGLIHASRRRLVTSWALVAMIVALVVALGHVAQPYRGIVDAGVVLGLVWGLLALVAFTAGALAGSPPRIAPDLPT